LSRFHRSHSPFPRISLRPDCIPFHRRDMWPNSRCRCCRCCSAQDPSLLLPGEAGRKNLLPMYDCGLLLHASCHSLASCLVLLRRYNNLNAVIRKVSLSDCLHCQRFAVGCVLRVRGDAQCACMHVSVLLVTRKHGSRAHHRSSSVIAFVLSVRQPHTLVL
jgi:hypothetical protein